MNRATAPAECPNGHAGGERIVSLVAAQPRGSAGVDPAAMSGGCACGGGGCGCAGG